MTGRKKINSNDSKDTPDEAFQLNQLTIWDKVQPSISGKRGMAKKTINITTLVSTLRKGEKKASERALEKLSKIEETAQVEKLVGFLNDESWHFRLKIEGVLSRIGEPAVVPLCNVIRNGVWYVRANAVSALGRIGSDDPEVFRVAAGLLKDPSSNVRKSAEECLVKLLNEQNVKNNIIKITREFGPDFAEDILTILNHRNRELYYFYISNKEEIQITDD